MAKTPHQYYLEVIGKGFVEDGAFGVQCVDGFIHWCRTQIGLRFTGGICYGGNPSGYAYRIWYNFDDLGLGKYFDKVPANKMVDGDWAIWNWNSKPNCPYSHIAMFRKDNGNGTGIFLGQNQEGISYYTQKSISYNGLLGALRPKIYHEVIPPKPPTPPRIQYRSHLAGTGWQSWKRDGNLSGTVGQSRRLEAIQIDYWGEVYAKAHIEGLGWKDFGKITKETVIGTEGKSLRLECLCLKGNFKYRVHLANYGWTCWTNADGICTLGSVGQALQIEAIEIIEI
jgi:hypothetical protein